MSATEKTKVALIQMRCSADPDENLRRALEFIRKAAGEGANIVCLPELFRSEYFCQSEDHANFALAEEIPGPSTRALEPVARELKTVIVASLFEKRTAGLYHNTAVVIDADGRTVGKYRKMHIPDDPAFYEKFYFTPGDLGFQAFDTAEGKVGVCVCWDQWYPEAARLTALRGAGILFYPTAIGWHPAEKAKFGAAQHSAWETMQRSHAIANGCFVCAANRIGHEIAGRPARARVLGTKFYLRAQRRNSGERQRRPGGNRRGRSRVETGGRTSHPLALPARSPHRRLRRDRAALAGLVGRPKGIPRIIPDRLPFPEQGEPFLQPRSHRRSGMRKTQGALLDAGGFLEPSCLCVSRGQDLQKGRVRSVARFHGPESVPECPGAASLPLFRAGGEKPGQGSLRFCLFRILIRQPAVNRARQIEASAMLVQTRFSQEGSHIVRDKFQGSVEILRRFR